MPLIHSNTVTKPNRACVSRFVLGALLAAGCLSVTPARAQSSQTQPKILSGELTRLRGQMVTKSKAAEIALPSGGRIRVRENTEASILTDAQSLMLLPGKKIATYTVILRRGIVEVDVPEAQQSKVAVAVGTPGDTRVLTLSGKTAIRASGRNVSAVSYSGLATATHGPKLTRIPNGVVRQYRPGGDFVDRPLLDSTRSIGGRRVWLAPPNGTAQPAGYVWAPVAGASGYLVSLRQQSSRESLYDTMVTNPVIENCPKRLTPGKYELAVAAIDGDGFASSKSAVATVHVVGLDLPGGAVTMPRDTVQITSEQRVRLTHADGLTLTTADHRSDVAASEAFGLEGLDRAVVLIHPKGGGDSAALTLVRREPSVSAWVGPKLATWPDDPINLQVSFVDQLGRPTPNEVEPSIRVLVGTEVVNVNWDKQGTLWQAKLPAPPEGRGPWVVRLEVVDQHGNIIGRDFAEVTKTHKRPKFHELQAEAVAVKPPSTDAESSH